jgi:hypothetical protein
VTFPPRPRASAPGSLAANEHVETIHDIAEQRRERLLVGACPKVAYELITFGGPASAGFQSQGDVLDVAPKKVWREGTSWVLEISK